MYTCYEYINIIIDASLVIDSDEMDDIEDDSKVLSMATRAGDSKSSRTKSIQY